MATTIHLAWPANPAGEQVNNYKVYESVNGGPFVFKANTAVPSLDIFNPVPQVYDWRVRAENIVGLGPEGPVMHGPTLPTEPGQGTVNVTVT